MESGIIPSNLLVAKERFLRFGRARPKYCGNLPDRLFFVTDKKTNEEMLKIEVGNSPLR